MVDKQPWMKKEFESRHILQINKNWFQLRWFNLNLFVFILLNFMLFDFRAQKRKKKIKTSNIPKRTLRFVSWNWTSASERQKNVLYLLPSLKKNLLPHIIEVKIMVPIFLYLINLATVIFMVVLIQLFLLPRKAFEVNHGSE